MGFSPKYYKIWAKARFFIIFFNVLKHVVNQYVHILKLNFFIFSYKKKHSLIKKQAKQINILPTKFTNRALKIKNFSYFCEKTTKKMKPELVESKTRDWDLLFAESDYIIMSELIKTLKSGNIEELEYAMEIYLEDIKRREERELIYNLRDLMQNILLWNYSVNYRSSENAVKISIYRSEIDMAHELEGCLTDETMKKVWCETFEEAKERAAIHEKELINSKELTWDEVFNKIYSLFHV